MKEVIVNRIKIKCSKGRINKGETVILSDEEVAKIVSFRPDSITVLRDVKSPAKTEVKKTTRKPRYAKSSSLDKSI